VAPAKKRRVMSLRIERPKGVAPHFRQVDTSDVQEVSTMFGGREFCVVNGSPDFGKEDMERKIVEHGGSLVQNPGRETYCVLVSRVIVRASNIISTGLHDVVKTGWLQECLDAGQCLLFEPRHMIFTKPATSTKFSQLYDQYGDSYTEDVTEDGLREIFKKVAEKSGDRLRVTREEIAEMESRYFPDSSPRGLFRRCRVYLDRYLEVGKQDTAIESCSLDLTGLELRLFGADLANDFDERVSHVIFDKDDLSRVPELRRMERDHSKKHHFVTAEWVSDSIESEFLKNERLYEPKV
jgi:DNA ligase-4